MTIELCVGSWVGTTKDGLTHVVAHGSSGTSVMWTYCDIDTYDALFGATSRPPTCFWCLVGKQLQWRTA
jgi:hypothetical protein